MVLAGAARLHFGSLVLLGALENTLRIGEDVEPPGPHVPCYYLLAPRASDRVRSYRGRVPFRFYRFLYLYRKPRSKLKL